MRTTLTSLLLVLSLSACGESVVQQQVRSAASVDLKCDEGDIEIVEEAALKTTLNACGEVVVYVKVCEGSSTGTCYWMLSPGEERRADDDPEEVIEISVGDPALDIEAGAAKKEGSVTGSAGVSAGETTESAEGDEPGESDEE